MTDNKIGDENFDVHEDFEREVLPHLEAAMDAAKRLGLPLTAGFASSRNDENGTRLGLMASNVPAARIPLELLIVPPLIHAEHQTLLRIAVLLAQEQGNSGQLAARMQPGTTSRH